MQICFLGKSKWFDWSWKSTTCQKSCEKVLNLWSDDNGPKINMMRGQKQQQRRQQHYDIPNEASCRELPKRNISPTIVVFYQEKLWKESCFLRYEVIMPSCKPGHPVGGVEMTFDVVKEGITIFLVIHYYFTNMLS